MENKVAVYGSLLSGLGNNRVMKSAGGTLLGKGTTQGFDLWDYCSGCYPAVSENEDASPLHVEVYEVSDAGLHGPLDMLEGYPSFYDRKQVDVILEDGTTAEGCWVYYHRSAPTGKELIISGDWRGFLND